MKKAIALALSLMLALALCACGGSSSSTTESSKADSSAVESKAEVTEAKAGSAVGSWVMESFKQESGTEDFEFTMSIDINEDGTFVFKQETETIKGESTGTYKEENGKYTFHSTHSSITYDGKTEEDDTEDEFTGELSGDKLTLVNSEAKPSTIYMKRA